MQRILPQRRIGNRNEPRGMGQELAMGGRRQGSAQQAGQRA
jgi:hypothetical protein